MAWWDEVVQQYDERSERLLTCVTSAESAEYGIGSLDGGTGGVDRPRGRWWRR